MRKKILTMFLILSMVFSMVISIQPISVLADSGNLLNNPGGETYGSDGLLCNNGWNEDTGTKRGYSYEAFTYPTLALTPHSGTYLMGFYATGGMAGVTYPDGVSCYQEITISTQKFYNLSGYLCLKKDVEGKATLRLEAFDSGGNKIGTAAEQSVTTADGDWKSVTLAGAIPTGAVKLRVTIEGVLKGNGLAAFDDLSLTLSDVAPTYIAKNDTTNTEYTTLQAAVDAVAEGDTIRLLKDITGSINIPSNNSKSFKIDLQGHTLDGGTSIAITHNGTGKLTIKDSGTDGKITSKIVGDKNGTIVLVSKIPGQTALAITGGTVENTNNGDVIYNIGGSVDISGGTLRVDNWRVILNDVGSTLNISGGTLSGNNSLIIYNNVGAKLNITGGTLNTSYGSVVYNNGGIVDISGGTLSTLGNTARTIENMGIETINITGGSIIATGGVALRNETSGIYRISSGTVEIKGGVRALLTSKPLEIAGYTKVKARASTNYDGSLPVTYNATDISTYKYLSFSENTDIAINNLVLTDKLTAPATGGTPETAINDDAQYTGVVSWNDNPSTFLGGTAYTATVTLTAKSGYTFDGVAQDAFTYSGATVTNTVGSGNTMIVTIEFPATAAKTLQSIAVTTPPTKTVYKFGEYFDTTEMVVKATYNDSTEDTAFTAYTVDKTDALTMSDTVVTLAATDNNTITTTQNITINKADGPSVNGVSVVGCTDSNNNDGKLAGVSTAMEYKKSGDTDYTSGNGSDITGLLANDTYQVRVKETDTHLAGTDSTFTIGEFVPDALNGAVAISGTPKFGQTLTATYASGNNSGTLSYQWKRGGANIGTNSATYTVVEEDINQTLTCEVTSSVQTGSVISAATSAIAKKDSTPITGVSAVGCTDSNNNDGKLVGVTTTMEYKIIGAGSYTSGTGNDITGLTPGTYLVRYKETATCNAGADSAFAVTAFTPASTYGISINKNGTHTFPSAVIGYSEQTPLIVTITNTGNQATGSLAVGLAGTNSGSFILSKFSIADIAASGSDSFTIKPSTGLAAGTYTATLTVNGSNGITGSFIVSFTVSDNGTNNSNNSNNANNNSNSNNNISNGITTGDNSSNNSATGDSATTGTTTGETSDTTTSQSTADTTYNRSNQQADTSTPSTEKIPYLAGEEGKSGWEMIISEIETKSVEAIQGPITIPVEMNGATVLPANVISQLRGKNINIVLDMGDGIIWTINGMDVTDTQPFDMDLGVSRNTNVIPTDVVDGIRGENNSIQIELAHNGAFGFTAKLTMDYDGAEAGTYANLFYYNEETGKLEYMESAQIGEDGKAEFTFEHASAYTIVNSTEPMDASALSDSNVDSFNQTEESTKVNSAAEVPATDETTGNMTVIWILLSIVVVVVAIGGTTIYMRHKKDEMKENEMKEE